MISLRAFLADPSTQLQLQILPPPSSSSSLWSIGTITTHTSELGHEWTCVDHELFYFKSWNDASLALSLAEQYFPDIHTWSYHTSYQLGYDVKHHTYGHITPEQYQAYHKQHLAMKRATQGIQAS